MKSLSPREDDVVREALTKICKSPGFVNAPQLRKFLDLVVTQTLEGKGAELKESVIGVEVFNKEPGWNSTGDSTVRTTATRVRTKLRKYYEVEGTEDDVIVELEGGTYV